MAIYITIFVIGLLIGSFLNVCIHRLPTDKSVIAPRSHCNICGQPISFWDLVPVISYLLLQGRCRLCGASFSLRYALVELLTAALFVWCVVDLELSCFLVTALILTCFLIVITFIDLDHQLILDKILIWFAGTAILINLLIQHVTLSNMVIASIAGGAILLIIAILTKGGMGGGDIKFVAALGLWLGLKLTLLTIFLSFIIGGIGSLLLLACKIKSRKDFIPFGPFISISAFISMLYGTEIISWYLQTIVK